VPLLLGLFPPSVSKQELGIVVVLVDVDFVVEVVVVVPTHCPLTHSLPISEQDSVFDTFLMSFKFVPSVFDTFLMSSKFVPIQ